MVHCWNQRTNFKNTWRQLKKKSTTLQTLWDREKEVLRGKFIAIQAYLMKQEKSQINKNLNIILCLKQLEKNKQNPKLVEGKKS